MKQLFHITPFDAAESLQPVLSIRVGEKHCAFAIVDLASQQLKQLAYYATEEITESFLSELFRAYAEFNTAFHKVLICYDYPWSTFVPSKFSKHEDAENYLRVLHGMNGTMSVLADPVEQWQLFNVYAVPKDIHDCIKRKFNGGKCWHSYSIAANDVAGTNNHGSISIDIRTNDFTLIAGKENKLLLAQTFSYSVPADVLYYLLKICQQLNFSQQEVKLILSGLIEKQSALYKELYQYFIHIEFREADWNFPDTSKNIYPSHFFTSLNDLARCAL